MNNSEETPDIDLTEEWDDAALDRLIEAIRNVDNDTQVIDLTEL